MEWSLYPESEPAQFVGRIYQSNNRPGDVGRFFSLDPTTTTTTTTDMTSTSPDHREDEAEFLFGPAASALPSLLPDPDHGSVAFDAVDWGESMSWHLGDLDTGDPVTASTPRSSPSSAEAMILADMGSHAVSSECYQNAATSAAQARGTHACSTRTRTSHTDLAPCPSPQDPSHPTSPCIAAATNVVNALHTRAEMCLSSPSSPSPASDFASLSSLSSSSSSSSTTSSSFSSSPPTTTIDRQGHHTKPSGARGIDTVLTSGREATSTILAALECEACSSRPQLHLLAATALEKLVGWYRLAVTDLIATSSTTSATTTIPTVTPPYSSLSSSSSSPSKHQIKINPPPPPPPTFTAKPPSPISTTSNGNTTTPTNSAAATAPSLTIAIGSHTVEAESALQTAVVAAVVACRLQELHGAIEVLAQRMMAADGLGRRCRDGGDDNDRRKGGRCEGGGINSSIQVQLPESVQDRLVGRVRERLAVVWRELNGVRESQALLMGGGAAGSWVY
ncbi:uncharacterized protein C8A04DRAFT_28631 [Dichotomopilus funicola]|uniref:Aflatoxin regulatory protein domain-containing protein n=1 Tax=Dichotomopilus funicola TaxID=1934379 RepID=A0AAN6V2P3_9PEZI|nr:hypothetical protein C8A04DRAFT_28631 [Dichotomopilus funicola]